MWRKYLVWYLVGIVVAALSPKPALIESLNILGPITLTALFASLLVPFAGLSANEKVQKWALQFAIVPLFGLYTVILWYTAAIGGIALFLMAAGVHVSYWTTSFHSREYRLNQFRLVCSEAPNLTRLIAVLNANGRSHEADALVQAYMRGECPDFSEIKLPPPHIENLIRSARADHKAA